MREAVRLVHPGRHVEFHTEPITAAEVMKKNPRHCITRPDVFKFPWIVVNPQSVLIPSRVYLIVPFHTIYKMLKEKERSQDLPSLPSIQCSESDIDLVVYHQPYLLKQTSSANSCAGFLPRHQNHNQLIKQPKKYISSRMACMHWLHDYDKRRKTQSGSRSRVHYNPEIETQLQGHTPPPSESDVGTSSSKEYEYRSQDISENLPKTDAKNSDDIGTCSSKEDECSSKDIWEDLSKSDANNSDASMPSEQVSASKSCIRKPHSNRRSLKLEVSFVLPTKDESDDEEHPWKFTDSKTFFLGQMKW